MSSVPNKMPSRIRRFLVSILVAVVLLSLLAIGVVIRFGWANVYQSYLLAYAVLFPSYSPQASHRMYGPWPSFLAPGEQVGRIVTAIPRIQAPVVEGTGDTNGTGGGQPINQFGHFAGSALPGQGQEVLLLGAGPSLERLTTLKIGALIEFRSSHGTFVYRVVKEKFESASTAVTLSQNRDILVLSLPAAPGLDTAQAISSSGQPTVRQWVVTAAYRGVR
ncbi:MAG: sortase family protein [Bacilli bacterium]